MNALKQYIDLYDSQQQVIDSGSSGVMNDCRHRARLALEDKELPGRETAGYTKTSVNDMMAPDMGINLARLKMDVDANAPFKCGIPHASTLLAIVANDRFVPASTLSGNLPHGVTVMSLARAAQEIPGLVAPYYGTVAPDSDSVAAFNTMLAQDGVLIHVAAGVNIEKPIQIVNILSSRVPQLAVRRFLIVLESGSSASLLLCDHTAAGSQPSVVSQVTEVILQPGARLDCCDIEENRDNVNRMAQVWVRQMQGSTLNWGGMTLHNGSTRNEYRVDIAGEHCSTQLSGIAIGDAKRHVDNSSDVIHNAPRSKSNQLFKYVLDGESTGAFQGSIEVTPRAQFTEAYQVDRNLLTSTRARMFTKPQLLIYNDDVKCSHGATTGQLDQQALFYMQSRGIPVEQARMMLVQAFMSDVIDSVGNEILRDRLRHLVEKRLQGIDAHCDDCAGSCK